MTDAEVELVLEHPATLICTGLLGLRGADGLTPEARLTPAQLERVGRRMWSWRATAGADKDDIAHASAIVRQAAEMANPEAAMADVEVDFVLASPALAALCAAPGWQITAQSLTKRQLSCVINRLDEIAAIQIEQAKALEALAASMERPSK